MSDAKLRKTPMSLPTDGRLWTDSSKPDDHFIREGAITILALDSLLGHDSAEAENAVAHARRMMDNYEHHEHDGDCVNQPMTCIRCMCDEALGEARKAYGE